MITVYILQADTLELSQIEQLPFGEAEKARLSAIENSRYKKESLGGLIALYRLLKKRNISVTSQIIRHKNGKPCFEENNSLPFGISHSNGIAAAALGDGDCIDIGFDLEVVNDNVDTTGIASRFFNSDEQADFERSGKTVEAFYSIWTKKEAYAKLNGEGLSTILSDNLYSKDAFLSRLKVDIGGKRVILSVACRSEGQAIQIFTDSEETE